MTKHSYFAIMFGLDGCYMPDSDYGYYTVTTRRDLINAMRDALAFYDFPKSAMQQVKWVSVWRHCKHPGASSLHFNAVQFSGLTQAEYEEREAQTDR